MNALQQLLNESLKFMKQAFDEGRERERETLRGDRRAQLVNHYHIAQTEVNP